MKLRLLLAAATLLGAIGSASAQEPESFGKSYSVEVSTGIPPLHMLAFAPTWAEEHALAQKGQEVNSEGGFIPVINVTGVLRPRLKTEFTLTAGTCWYHHRLTQYSTFGTDPEGKDRYDLKDGRPAGWTNSNRSYSLTFQWRHLWNPGKAFTMYTALGAGLVYFDGDCVPLPSLTPIAFRYGGRHFYAFTELTLGTMASLVQGGLGWRF